MWYKALLEVLQHQMEVLSPRLQKADLEQQEDTCALLAAACSHAKAFSELMQVTRSQQRKQVHVRRCPCTFWLECNLLEMAQGHPPKIGKVG